MKQYQERQQKEAEEEARAKAEAAKKAAEAKRPPKRAAAPGRRDSSPSRARSEEGRGQSRPGEEVLPPPPMLPEALSDWQEGDLYIARMRNDPSLPLAVERFGQQTIGDPKAAEILTGLLKPWRPDGAHGWTENEGKRRGRPDAKSGQAALIEAIAAALGANGTPAARQTLGQMIAGRLATEHDRTAAMAALQSLVNHPGPENEALLFQILTSAAKIRPPGQGEVTAEELRKAALTLLQDAATRRFRLRIAEYYVDPATLEADREFLAPLLRPMHPENFEAQAVLFQSPVTDAAMKRALEPLLAQYSCDALGRFLRVPPQEMLADPALLDHLPPSPPVPFPQAKGSGETASEEAEWPARVASRLWGPESCRQLQERLALITALGDGAGLVTLASTIPNDLLRLPLDEALDRHWEDGPKSLREAGLGSRVICEPGFLPAFKTAQRRQEGLSRAEAARYSSGRSAAAADLIAARQKHIEQLNRDWLQLLQDLAQAYCDRLRAAAQAQAEAIRKSGHVFRTFDPPAGLPVALHTNDFLFAAYRLDWPADVAERVSAVPADPLEISYVRIEEKTRPSKMLGYYRRQLKHYEMRPLPDGVWLDSLAPVPGSDRKRSIDVFITAATPDLPRLPDEEQKLILEILSIEVRDPAKE